MGHWNRSGKQYGGDKAVSIIVGNKIDKKADIAISTEVLEE